MRTRLEQEPVIADFTEKEVAILKAAADQLPGVDVVDIPKKGDVYIHPKTRRQIQVEEKKIAVELKGNLGVLFERANQISSELERTSKKISIRGY